MEKTYPVIGLFENPLYKFVIAYRMLLHAESHMVSHILDKGISMDELIASHNVLEDAKAEVVQEYVMFSVTKSSRSVDTEKK